MTKKKYIVFAFVTVTLTFVLFVGALFALDVYEHHKMATSGGLNVWGYRGPTVGRKKPGEQRVALLGESTAFGYGVRWNEAIPAYLQDALNRGRTAGPPISVVNLAYNNEGAHSYKFTLEDYEYLKYDAVILYSGYNDLAINLSVYRHTSPIFRAFGYMPILPLVLREKSMAIRYGGNLEAAYKEEKTVFRPNIGQRTTASALALLANGMYAANRPSNSEGTSADAGAIKEGAECGPKWAHYCGGMYTAVKYALDRQKKVMMVTQPRYPAQLEDHIDQQRRLVAFLKNRFQGNTRLYFASVTDAVNVLDPALSYDAMHLTAAGNKVVAEKLAAPVAEMLR